MAIAVSMAAVFETRVLIRSKLSSTKGVPFYKSNIVVVVEIGFRCARL